MSLAALKKSRMSFEELAKKFENEKKSTQKDDRFYYPARDDNGNAHAVIRFLMPPEGEDSPWVKTYSHAFKSDSGRWFIEECPTTIGKDCVCCSENGKLWNSGIESDKDIVRQRKRRLQYVANILVVEDKKNPENEGKVFLFKFGAKIFDMIKGAMYPEFDDEEPCNVFDFWEGANFNLRIRKVAGQTNYDKSSFGSPAPIADSDEKIERIWKQEYSLAEFLSPDRFKSEEELAKSFARAVGGNVAAPVAEAKTAPTETAPEPIAAVASSEPTSSAMDFFRKMAEED